MARKPARLTRGHTIGIVAPSSPPRDPADIDRWIAQIEALGFRTKRGPHVADRHGYFAGFDRDRAADVNAMFAASFDAKAQRRKA
jgi:muramoyltetrapeptide carboxypeptidase